LLLDRPELHQFVELARAGRAKSVVFIFLSGGLTHREAAISLLTDGRMQQAFDVTWIAMAATRLVGRF
jgi:hypothetical protein